MRQWGVLAACGLLLGGCQTTSENPAGAEAPVFGRADCQRGANDPALQREFEVAKAVCTNRAEAAAVAGTAAIPVGRGMAGAIASGIERGVAQGQISRSTAIGCMAEYGYLLRTLTEHESACSAIAESRKPATPVRARPVVTPPRSKPAPAEPRA